MTTEETVDYSDWTTEDCEDRIAEIMKEYDKLEDYIADKKVELTKSIEEVQARLQALLGGDDIADGTYVENPKRKSGGKRGERGGRGGRGGQRGGKRGGGNGVKKRNTGGRKTKDAKRKFTDFEEVVDEEWNEEAVAQEEEMDMEE